MLMNRIIIATGTAVVAVLRVIGGALYQPDDGERVSTWSVRKRDARTFYLLLAALWIGAAGGLAWAQYDPAPPRVVEWATLPPHTGDGSVFVVGQRFGVVVIPLLAAALLLTPVMAGIGRVLMTIVSFINEKILDPFIESQAIAPRMAVREEQMQAREARLQTREEQMQKELQTREEQMQTREQELQAREARLQTREQELQAREDESVR